MKSLLRTLPVTCKRLGLAVGAVGFLGLSACATVQMPNSSSTDEVIARHAARLLTDGYILECDKEARLHSRIRKPVCRIVKDDTAGTKVAQDKATVDQSG